MSEQTFVNVNNSDDEIRAALEEAGSPTLPTMSRAILIHMAEEAKIWQQVLHSVVPDSYKERYGPAQHCGDDIAEMLKGEDIHEIGAANGINVDAKWGNGRIVDGEVKPLNPGMQRMNLGNVLRGRVRRGEYVIVGDVEFNEENKAAKA